jgi:hypothetical protein
MNEKVHDKVETSHHEKLDMGETSKRNLEKIKESAEQAEHDHSIDKIQASIHKEAISAKEVTVGERRQDSQQHLPGVHKALKADAYLLSLKKIRGHLSKPQQAFSRIVHHPAIEPINEVGSKTVARPSGLLGSGIFALTGSGVLLYMAKHYGFRYNFMAFVILALCGFVVGLLIEACAKILRRS